MLSERISPPDALYEGWSCDTSGFAAGNVETPMSSRSCPTRPHVCKPSRLHLQANMQWRNVTARAGRDNR